VVASAVAELEHEHFSQQATVETSALRQWDEDQKKQKISPNARQSAVGSSSAELLSAYSSSLTEKVAKNSKALCKQEVSVKWLYKANIIGH
jgi:hypothetical protein